MNNNELPQGYIVHVHRSLTQPFLMGGVPRKVAILNATFTTALVMGLHSVWVIPFAFAFHLTMVSLHKNDPEFLDVLIAHLKQSKGLGV